MGYILPPLALTEHQSAIIAFGQLRNISCTVLFFQSILSDWQHSKYIGVQGRSMWDAAMLSLMSCSINLCNAGFVSGWTATFTLSTWEINFVVFKEPLSISVSAHGILVIVCEALQNSHQ